MSKKIRTIFIGTPDFGLPSLKALIESPNFEMIAVITQPDKKIGRQQILTPPPIKKAAQEYNLPVLQPEKINLIGSTIKELKPDLAIVIAYAQIISKELLEIPKHGFVNVHGSLLPKYRGAACIQAAILNGDEETGVTVMQMDPGLDTGPIISQTSIPIAPCDTGGTLFLKLSELGAKTLISTLKKYVSQEIKPQIQNNDKATYVGLLKKEDGKINWEKPAQHIERHIRAMHPWPGAFSQFQNKNREIQILKILNTEHVSLKINKHNPGEMFLHNQELAIQCGQDSLLIKKIQLAGKKIVTGEEFINGHRNLIGKILK